MAEPPDALPDDHPVVLFDGVCNLCNAVVQFILPRDPEGVFRFASLQSAVGQSVSEAYELPTEAFDSVVLVEDGDCYTRSDAALRILRRLGGVYRLLSYARVVPRPIRDAVYDLVATYRYRVFGRREACARPPEDAESRFLDFSDEES
ncbi:thiol-disulfide oxidoreductase DCC family protein [Halococcoides cellulosivorans]|uniref:Thiol-disulfide oxidoreductase DCC n=1 Tax=Halococcoides cellulosivorans TaxID=1679096 RepID=A0A2R4WY33_9EURY|nr:thiol-disulfide oxidoreductase DCC family protein [Halococcoides cellulosivorans]AWB26455.1 thiol-disulfide oxidoreductase DCC [Halococcoides cellulosivorans]